VFQAKKLNRRIRTYLLNGLKASMTSENPTIKARIERIRQLTGPEQGTIESYEAASVAQSVIHDTIGGSHPVMSALDGALHAGDVYRAMGAARAVLALYDEGALTSPRLAIAHEIEGGLLDIAQAQVEDAERGADPLQKQTALAIATFLAGSALEDALRRLCDASGLVYDAQRASISKLQAALFQPSKQIEIISVSENKQITAWGDTRNKADHGRFADLTHTEVLTIVLGVRSFIDKHLP
jgi:hypothetical protein